MLQVLLEATDNLTRAVSELRHEATIEASVEIVRRTAVELPGAVDRLTQERYAHRILVTATIMVCLFGAGVALGYWMAAHGYG